MGENIQLEIEIEHVIDEGRNIDKLVLFEWECESGIELN